MGEKWKNLPFLGRPHTLVPVPKVGTGTHYAEGIWYQYQKLGYRYPFTSKELVPIPIKMVSVPMLLAALIFKPLHC